MNTPEQTIENYTDAIAATDVDALMALYRPHARIFDMTMPWQHNGLDSWREKVTAWFGDVRGTDAGAEVSQVEVTPTDGMVLVTLLVNYFDTDDSGERRGMVNRLTWVLVPDGDDWKILHEHTSAPLTNDDMTVVFAP